MFSSDNIDIDLDIENEILENIDIDIEPQFDIVPPLLRTWSVRIYWNCNLTFLSYNPNKRSKIQGKKGKIQDTRCKMQDARCKMQD